MRILGIKQADLKLTENGNFRLKTRDMVKALYLWKVSITGHDCSNCVFNGGFIVDTKEGSMGELRCMGVDCHRSIYVNDGTFISEVL